LAKIELTPTQEAELKSKGMLAKPVTDVVSNRRCYWDPRKDEAGNVMGWTRPLPGDTVRMTFYLNKGFKLEDPDGNIAPPPGYFQRRITPISTPKKVTQVGAGEGQVGQKKVEGPSAFKCPICQKDFPGPDALVHHMTYHRSAKAKAKARKPKRGGARIAPRKSETNNLKKEEQ